jgi:hypothetical protein
MKKNKLFSSILVVAGASFAMAQTPPVDQFNNLGPCPKHGSGIYQWEGFAHNSGGQAYVYYMTAGQTIIDGRNMPCAPFRSYSQRDLMEEECKTKSIWAMTCDGFWILIDIIKKII